MYVGTLHVRTYCTVYCWYKKSITNRSSTEAVGQSNMRSRIHQFCQNIPVFHLVGPNSLYMVIILIFIDFYVDVAVLYLHSIVTCARNVGLGTNFSRIFTQTWLYMSLRRNISICAASPRGARFCVPGGRKIILQRKRRLEPFLLWTGFHSGNKTEKFLQWKV